MYKRTVTANRRSAKWNTNLVFVRKPDQVQTCLIFNYHFIYKNIPASHIKTATIMHDLLNILSNQSLFSTDIRHGYWVVNVYPNNRHYLAFHLPRIGQVQPTH